MNTTWIGLDEKSRRGYVYWKHEEAGQAIYNCTKNDTPPTTSGGYPNLLALRKLKNDYSIFD